MRAAGISDSDIIVVAPYNAQVNLLRERLPSDIRVGTVDKFQGQEALVVLYSMASSSGQEIPRGLEFLLSRNRLNVAISRAWNINTEKSITLRAESINFLNTPQFAEPSTDLTNPSFGKITNTLNDGRTFQFQLRFRF